MECNNSASGKGPITHTAVLTRVPVCSLLTPVSCSCQTGHSVPSKYLIKTRSGYCRRPPQGSVFSAVQPEELCPADRELTALRPPGLCVGWQHGQPGQHGFLWLECVLVTAFPRLPPALHHAVVLPNHGPPAGELSGPPLLLGRLCKIEGVLQISASRASWPPGWGPPSSHRGRAAS